ncbi:MAG: hypothetical protein QM820_41315 [Minicystis sp.]
MELKDGEKKELKLFVPEGPPPSGVPLNPADNPDANKPAVAPPDAPTKDQAEGKFMTPLRGAGIGVAAVGVAGVVVGAIFMAKSGSTQSQADAQAAQFGCNGLKCPVPVTPQQQAAVEAFTNLDKDAASQKTIAAVGFGLGGLALAGGVTMLIVGKPKPGAAPAKKASVEPWFNMSSLGLRGQF